MKSREEKADVHVIEMLMETARINVLGTTPLVPHAMSKKGREELLYPAGRKNAAERATSMKHEPFDEYREALYQFRDEDQSPTRLYMPAAAFHSALASAALDIKGAKKQQVGRLTSVKGTCVPVWGIPQIFTSVVIQAGIGRTPDIRTLPILPQWCCTFEVEYANLIKRESIWNLLGAAGVIIGVGDGRPEKIKLNYGKFRLCADDDPLFQMIMKTQGRKPQDAAIASPAYYDRETEKLLTWFLKEKLNRHARPAQKEKVAAPPASVIAGKRKRNGRATAEA